MAIFNIPQFIETEDKIAGPLTAKQLGWLVSAAATVFVIYLFVGKTGAFILAIPVLLFYGAFAFYKPNGQPLTFIALSLVQFIFQPKLYVWKRLPDEVSSKKRESTKKAVKAPEKKVITEKKIEEISELLDSPRKQTAKKAYDDIIFSSSPKKKPRNEGGAKVRFVSSSQEGLAKKAETKIRIINSSEEEIERKTYGNITFK